MFSLKFSKSGRVDPNHYHRWLWNLYWKTAGGPRQVCTVQTDKQEVDNLCVCLLCGDDRLTDDTFASTLLVLDAEKRGAKTLILNVVGVGWAVSIKFLLLLFALSTINHCLSLLWASSASRKVRVQWDEISPSAPKKDKYEPPERAAMVRTPNTPTSPLSTPLRQGLGCCRAW